MKNLASINFQKIETNGSLFSKILLFLNRLSLNISSKSSIVNRQDEYKYDTAPKYEGNIQDILEKIIDFTGYMIYFKDIRLKYRFYNYKFKKFFNIENIDLDYFDFHDKDFAYLLKKYEREVLKNKTPYIFEYSYKDRDLYVKIVPIVKDEMIGVAGIIEDITKYQKKIDNLKSYNEYLKRRCNVFEKLSMLDPLTGVFNKKKFKIILEKEIERAKRYNETLSLIIFDIDNFKMINDKYGHLVGDLVIKKIIGTIKENIRKIDIISRIGGDEFTIIAPNTDIDSAMKLTNKLLNAIDNIDFKKIDKKVTCSFGITKYIKNESLEQLFKRADDALYISKDGGRDRISIK